MENYQPQREEFLDNLDYVIDRDTRGVCHLLVVDENLSSFIQRKRSLAEKLLKIAGDE